MSSHSQWEAHLSKLGRVGCFQSSHETMGVVEDKVISERAERQTTGKLTHLNTPAHQEFRRLFILEKQVETGRM